MTDLRIFDPTKVRAIVEEKDALIAELRAELLRVRTVQQQSAAVEALRELVALKNLKDRIASLSFVGFVGHATCEGITFGPDFTEWRRLEAEYARRKSLAWAAARAALSPKEQTGDPAVAIKVSTPDGAELASWQRDAQGRLVDSEGGEPA